MSYETTEILYSQKELPVLQNCTYDTQFDAKNCLKGDIVLVEDQDTGFVFNRAFLSEKITYDRNYQNEQAYSPFFMSHLEVVAEIVEKNLGKTGIVEVGCGKGTFLEMLSKKGFEISGFDPAYEGKNSCISRKKFEQGVGIKASGIILRHVLEHINNPYDFLVKLKDANGGGGKIYIEVPCFDWICDKKAWFDIFYEHVNYFRLSDFKKMFGKMIDCGYLFGDQYFYVVVDLKTIKKPIIDKANSVLVPSFLIPSFEREAAIWGCASKGVIFSLMMRRHGCTVTNVIDINPAKQGRYLPVTGLRVESPKEAIKTLKKGANVYVMNSNYFEEITEMSNQLFNYIEVGND